MKFKFTRNPNINFLFLTITLSEDTPVASWLLAAAFFGTLNLIFWPLAFIAAINALASHQLIEYSYSNWFAMGFVLAGLRHLIKSDSD